MGGNGRGWWWFGRAMTLELQQAGNAWHRQPLVGACFGGTYPNAVLQSDPRVSRHLFKRRSPPRLDVGNRQSGEAVLR